MSIVPVRATRRGRALLAGLVLAALVVPPCAALSMEDFRETPIQTPVLAGQLELAPADPAAAGVNEHWALVRGLRQVRNVTRPALIPVLPDPARATGAAVIVAPGGGFLGLAIDAEGFEVARRLADHGIAAFVLKYRLERTPDDPDAFMAMLGRMIAQTEKEGAVAVPGVEAAAQDAVRALRLVRAGATRWRIDPARVGMIGFSAGAMTAMQVALAPAAADRPAFVGYIYGPMAARPVPADAPPAFVALALDDRLFGKQGFGIVESWHQAHVPVELHAYETGDHGFGTGVPGTTTTLLMDEFIAWLDVRTPRPAAQH